MNKKIIPITLAAVLIIGIFFVSNSNEEFDEKSDGEDSDKQEVVLENSSEDDIVDTENFLISIPEYISYDIDDTNWVEESVGDITFRHPEEWLIEDTKFLPFNQSDLDSSYAGPFMIHEGGFDPTWVGVGVVDAGVVEAIKLSKYEELLNGDLKFLEKTNINGRTIVRTNAHMADKGCIGFEYFHVIDEDTTGFVMVSGTCASHPDGYDETKVQVAESVVFE